MTAGPLVSCIMPTRDRRPFVAQALTYFLRQDYPWRELVVVDDGADAVGDLLAGDDRVRYLRLDGRHRLGAKRNLACQASRGELIAHWDDDDWIRSDRLTLQVRTLTGAGASACGLGELLHYRPLDGDAWRYRPLGGDAPWLAGGTLLYRRDAWRANPFVEADDGEDSTFVRRLAPSGQRALRDDGWYLALLHPGNTARKQLKDPRWRRAPLDEVSGRLGADRAFYAALRNGRLGRAAPAAARGAAVTLAADLLVYDGYGSMAEYLALGMARAGASVRLAPLALDRAGLTPELLRLLERRPGTGDAPQPAEVTRGATRSSRGYLAEDGPVLWSSWVRPELDRFTSRELFIHTMWESDRLPPGWVARLNQARAVLVPTRFVAGTCRASGVTAPLAVVPDGIDPDVYRLERRPARPGLTTLLVGTAIGRKHLAEGVAAWKLAFDGDPEARLLVKSRFRHGGFQPDDPRIRFMDASEPTRGIAHWYRRADVLLALGNEGFGLPLVEGMATGLPVVALDSEGQRDICEEAGELLLPVAPVRFEPHDDSGFGTCGVRGVPGVAEVAERLRWVATHREEAAAMGRAASAWARGHRNVWDKGPAVLEVMERHLRPPRPLRRGRLVFVPSWGRRCGVAEYAAALLAHLPGTRAADAVGDPRRLRLLHAEHEDGLLGDAALAAELARARDAGVPAVVTAHAVWPQPRAYEAQADALVALTATGAARLRSRAPGKPVLAVSPGCPTWSPPRKRERGRVLGAFGFLERHKGFWRLLDVLREVPGTELLLFAHARSEAAAADWLAASAGLPVRWERRFLPAERVAARLAAEADLLAFWYDEVPHASASGAVRVGLASGVPVLASPTTWFADLGDVTYQPDGLVEGVRRLLEDTPLRDRLAAAAHDHCHQHTWRRVATAYERLWDSVERP